ncbi:MAG: DUF1465 family protein [Sphingobium sp.]
MSTAESIDAALFFRLVDGLYVDAMVMADEARSYFDRIGGQDHGSLDTMSRLSFTCESLKVTTRLMHVIAWLLTQRAWRRGEISGEALADPKYRLGPASPSDDAVLAALPEQARLLVEDSQSLYERVARLQRRAFGGDGAPHSESDTAAPVPSPARDLLGRLEQAF